MLTLFERLTADELPFYLHLMQHFAGHGIPVANPVPDHEARILHRLKEKPAVVVDRLRGKSEPVHGDLFRDNVMFEGERITGVLDFYLAGCDTWLHDMLCA